MRAKSLAHWTELFKVADAPWLRSDWETVLNILYKLLSITNALDGIKEERLRKGSIGFHELFSLAQLHFGVPRVVVVCDTKQTIAENQLAIFTVLYALKFSTPMITSKRIRALCAASSVVEHFSFNMDVDDRTRYCAHCRAAVALVERCFVENVVWHRGCLKCFVCKRLVSLGAFLLVDGNFVECVEHFANRVLYGDAMHCLERKKAPSALNTPPASASNAPAAAGAQNPHESPDKVTTPPPRPPPPKLVRDSPPDVGGRAAADASDSTKKSKKMSSGNVSAKSSPHSSEKNWEMLAYPTELNPFGSEEEDDGRESHHQFDLDFDETCKTTSASSNNPFTDDSDDATASDLEEVENPSDRVVSSNDNFSPTKSERTERSSSAFDDDDDKSTMSTPPSSVTSPVPKPRTSANANLKSSKIVDKAEDEEEETDDETNPFNCSTDRTMNASETEDDGKRSTGVSSPVARRRPPPPKPPRFADDAPSDSSAAARASSRLANATAPGASAERKYVPPQLVYREKNAKLVCGTTLYELGIQLRKLNCQMAQLETTGKRLETQILRSIIGGKFEWKKSKIVEEYLAVIERKCEAFRIETTLVYEYMNAFVDETHQEVEDQMKALREHEAQKQVEESDRRNELVGALAMLLDMKNSLITRSQRLTPASAKMPSSADACKSLKKFSSPSVLKKGMKQTMKSLKKKL